MAVQLVEHMFTIMVHARHRGPPGVQIFIKQAAIFCAAIGRQVLRCNAEVLY